MVRNLGELISLLILNLDKVKSRYFNHCRAVGLLLIALFGFILFLICQNPFNWTSILFYFLILILLILTKSKIQKLNIKLRVDRELTRANLYLSKLDEKIVLTPQIFINKPTEFTLVVSFVSSLKNHKKLAELDLGAILNYNQIDIFQDSKTNMIKFVLEKKMDRKLYFFDEFDFDEYFEKYRDKKYLIIDKINKIPVTHTFFVGATGSGKTVALSFLIKQLINKSYEPNILMLDRKRSDLYLLFCSLFKYYKKVYYSSDNDKIIDSLKNVLKMIEYRRKHIADYKQHNKDFELFVVVFDEYISFYNSLSKKEQEIVRSIITEVLVIGRELNIFLWIAQQSPTVESSGLSTYLKSQFLVNIYLRPNMTNRIGLDTLFGKGVLQNVFVSNFGAGEGYVQNLILSDENPTATPKILSFPPPF